MFTKEVPSSANPSETTSFRKLLMTLCQKEFEKGSAGHIDVEKRKKEIDETCTVSDSGIIFFSSVEK